MMIPGMTAGPINRNREKDSSLSLLVAIVESGSLIGVSAAPIPIEKQAEMMKRTSDLGFSFRILVNATNAIATIMAVMTLDIIPSMMTARERNKRKDIF